eukprot:9481004-Heterocapsa_arctica.AAC.1
MCQPEEHQGSSAEAQEETSTELIGTGAQEEEPVPHQKHKGSQSDLNPVTVPHVEGGPLTQQEREGIWLEGYEAARKEIHEAVEGHEEARKIWKQFFQEIQEKEIAEGQGGEAHGKGVGRKGQGSGPRHGKGTERASGSTESANFGSEEARESRRAEDNIEA